MTSWHLTFQSTPPVWGATQAYRTRGGGAGHFNPRPPCGGRPLYAHPVSVTLVFISIHAPRVGGDVRARSVAVRLLVFQSTPPVWGATQAYRTRGGGAGHFNPRPPCGGRPLYAHPVSVTLVFISIHAPRVGGDVRARSVAVRLLVFQSTPPVWGATRCSLSPWRWTPFQSTPPVWGATWSMVSRYPMNRIFQSTPPVWGATFSIRFASRIQLISIHAPRVGGDSNRKRSKKVRYNFNPRPPCGGRLCLHGSHPLSMNISIHAPRVGGDSLCFLSSSHKHLFQSTPPVWGATFYADMWAICFQISIHAPRVGGDMGASRHRPPTRHFNPRPPCGGRQPLYSASKPSPEFQSTPPVWGATVQHSVDDFVTLISIHAPRVGGDSSLILPGICSFYFNPRPPCGGRQRGGGAAVAAGKFQSTPPVWGATVPALTGDLDRRTFQSTPPVWGATLSAWFSVPSTRLISIHAPPVWGATLRAGLQALANDISIHAPRVGGDPAPRLPVRPP